MKIEPATLRLVAQCLFQLRHRVTLSPDVFYLIVNNNRHFLTLYLLMVLGITHFWEQSWRTIACRLSA